MSATGKTVYSEPFHPGKPLYYKNLKVRVASHVFNDDTNEYEYTIAMLHSDNLGKKIQNFTRPIPRHKLSVDKLKNPYMTQPD
ncbi:hypothetical protein OAD26_00570 [bacterium]|nr:hypothetical protein [bacterium]